MSSINQRLRIPEKVMSEALELILQEKLQLSPRVESEIKRLLALGLEEGPRIRRLRQQIENISLEQAYQKISIYGAFHNGKSPGLTAGWQLAILAGVSPEVALKGVESTELDKDGRNMAHYAAWSGNLHALDYVQHYHRATMRQTHVDILAEMSFAHYAIWSGNIEMLPKCSEQLKKNPEICAWFAGLSGNKDMLKRILDENPQLKRDINISRFSFVGFAGLSGNLDMMKMLFAHCPELKTVNSATKTTYAYSVARSGNLETLQYIYEQNPTLFENFPKDQRSMAYEVALSGNAKAFKWIVDTYMQKYPENHSRFIPANIVYSAARSRNSDTLNYALEIIKSKEFDLNNTQSGYSHDDMVETLMASLQTNATLMNVTYSTQFDIDNKDKKIIEGYLERNRIIQNFEKKYGDSPPYEHLINYCHQPATSTFFIFGNQKEAEQKKLIKDIEATSSAKTFTYGDWITFLKKTQLKPSNDLSALITYFEAKEKLDINIESLRARHELEARQEEQKEADEMAGLPQLNLN